MEGKRKNTGIVELKNFQQEIYSETLESLKRTGQGAISLFPCGGKTFIGAEIACQYINRTNGNKDVLWLGPKQAVENIRESVINKLPQEYKEHFRFISFESISIGNVNKDTLTSHSNNCLIVIDESHKALADHRVGFIMGILRDMECDRLAMSATERRTDGRHSFEFLVPSAVYHDYDIGWGARHGIINELNYKLSTANICKLDDAVIEQYGKMASIFEEEREKFDKFLMLLNSYHNKMSNGFYNVLKNSGLDFSAKHGDRHIVFYPTIETAKQAQQLVFNTFRRLYGPNKKINVYQYNSKASEAENNNVLKHAVNSIPEKNTVDVIITVNKGIESIHPRNIRSVSIFRATASQIVFTQQIGRGITLKDFCDSSTYVFDFANEDITLLRGVSINYGRDIATFRDKTGAGRVYTLDDMSNRIRRALSDDIEVKAAFALPELAELSNRISSEYITVEQKYNMTQIDWLLNRYNSLANIKTISVNVKNPSMPDLYAIARYVAAHEKLPETATNIFNESGMSKAFDEWAKRTRFRLVSEQVETGSDEWERLHKYSHLFYTSANTHQTDIEALDMIDSARNLLMRASWDESKLSGYGKSYLKKLREQWIYDKFNSIICSYARHMNVDITTNQVKLSGIKSMILKSKQKYPLYSLIIKQCDALREAKEQGKPAAEIDDLWASTTALMLMANRTLTLASCRKIARAIRMEYRDVLELHTVPDDTTRNCNIIEKIVYNSKNGYELSKISEEYLFANPVFRDIDKVEQYTFRALGVKSNKAYSELYEHTAWFIKYNKALNGDSDAIVSLMRVDKSKLDKMRLKMLSSTKFKSVVAQQKAGVERQIAISRAKALYTFNQDIINAIDGALKNGSVSEIDIVKAPFNGDAAKLIEFILEMPGNAADNFKSLTKNDACVIKAALTSPTSCTSMIIPNILMIPSISENSKDMLREMMRMVHK